MMDNINENMIFILNSQRSPENSDLLHLEWAVVSQLDGRKTVGHIAENLALNHAEIEEIFKKLLSEKLVILASRHTLDTNVPVEFFRILNHEMTLLLGPVADIILEDVFTTMHQNRENFDQKYISTLIDLLTNQIDDPVKQFEFQRNIYPKIRDYLLK